MIHFCQQIKCDNNGTITDKTEHIVFNVLQIFTDKNRQSEHKVPDHFRDFTLINKYIVVYITNDNSDDYVTIRIPKYH